MEISYSLALSRQLALQHKLEVTANNIANVNTSGFKAGSLLIRSEDVKPSSNKNNLATDQPWKMAYDWSGLRDYRQGGLKTTGSPLDLAITGEGFFTVNTPNGPRYTRGGAFSMNDQGEVVDGNGNQLQGDGSAVTIPNNAKEINIATDGTLSVDGQVQGKIQIVKFDDPQSLQTEGNDLYNGGNQTAQPLENAQMVQGAIEQSNVNSVFEMTDMIEISRQYEATQGMVQRMHDREQNAIRTIGKVT